MTGHDKRLGKSLAATGYVTMSVKMSRGDRLALLTSRGIRSRNPVLTMYVERPIFVGLPQSIPHAVTVDPAG